MSDALSIQIDPKEYRLDGRLMRRIGMLLKPYWLNKAHWKSWLLLTFSILVGPAWAYYNYKIAFVASDQANALVGRDSHQWFFLFWLLAALGFGQWVYGQVMDLLNTLMRMQYYRWMTEWMVDRYMRNKTYYDIAMKGDIDNPDERIQDNVEPFIGAFVGLPGQVLGTILGLITGGVLMTQVTTGMMWFVIIYSFANMALQTLIVIPLIRKNFERVAAFADFRFGLLRIRDNAETIAFFRGEEMEKRQISDRLSRNIKNRMDIYYYNLKMGFLTFFTGKVWEWAPLVFIYPLYFSGKIEFGMIALATGAAGTLAGAIQSVQGYFPMLAGVAPTVVRLSQIVERFNAMEEQAAKLEEHIHIDQGDYVELDDVCFETPGGEQKLAQHVSLRVDPGESLIIIGQTGVGKSSILRSMAGLWIRGSGRMVMPPPRDTMFVPQKPYMMLGNLRAQLLYPHGRDDMSEAELQKILETVCLPDLIANNGGLQAECDWSKVLSLGEQQRVSFARILISKPKFVFLDESTSAVDIPTEARLYQALSDAGVTFISVGHRETILRFHDRALRLVPGGSWEILESRMIETTPVAPLGAARPRMIVHAVAEGEAG
ncbi:ABC transporter ATP-binding protein/permease [Sphingomonas sp.]|uniref:ABC transporter ATP-binding protein/permease n=1 Tax=Sphingomonas sp. TaxID=28214 RepID=UPI0025E49DEA|nr:ATP-binding cassette domain-containing protein [Sphingomonas sp.]